MTVASITEPTHTELNCDRPKLPTLKAILAEIARKATHDVRILIEYGMVSGGNGQTIRAGESVATEGKIDIQDIGWGAFQGLKRDRCTEMHLIKMRNVGDRKSEILTISHEIGAHIAEIGHPGWGLSTNPYYDRTVGAGNGETPTSGSPAEALMKELNLLVK